MFRSLDTILYCTFAPARYELHKLRGHLSEETVSPVASKEQPFFYLMFALCERKHQVKSQKSTMLQQAKTACDPSRRVSRESCQVL
jgi:hypothetical protein